MTTRNAQVEVTEHESATMIIAEHKTIDGEIVTGASVLEVVL